MTHPDLKAAETPFDMRAVLRILHRAREAAAEGRYCECAAPELTGQDLLCAGCLHHNWGQETRAVIAIVEAHDFTPREGPIMARFCARCMMTEDDPRHHGTPAVGRTTYGTEIRR